MIISKIKLNNSKYKKSLKNTPIKTQTVLVKCDTCEKEYRSSYSNIEINRKKYN